MDTWSRRVDPELILSHQEWLRRLAQRLVRDPGTAEDLTQEAWTVLASRPAAPGGVRGFLAGVVRHLSLKSRRSTDRRERHEARAAREEATPSTAELALRLEIQRAVADALEELDEPYRETLLLRFFEGLSPKQIAERQGIPPGTVRARLSRGLEQLRSSLDARFGGDRRAWCLPLLVWLGGPEGRLTLPIIKAAALLLFVAGSLWIGWIRLASPLPDRTDTPVESPTTLALATTEGELTKGGNQAPNDRTALGPGADQPATPAEAPPWIVHARILDARGNPLRGASVELEIDGENVAMGRSDRDGRTSLEMSPDPLPFDGRTAKTFAVVTRAAGYLPLRRRFDRAEQNEQWLGTLVPRIESGVEGRVVDELGNVVPGALVVFKDYPGEPEAWARTTRRLLGPKVEGVMEDPERRLVAERCNAQGKFRVVGSEGFREVWAGLEGYEWSCSGMIEARPGRIAGPVTLVLREVNPAEMISGQVVAAGQPNVAAHISAEFFDQWGSPYVETRTGEGGVFQLPCLGPVASSIFIEVGNVALDDLRLENIPAGTHGLVIALPTRRVHAVRVRWPGGELPARCSLRVLAPDGSEAGWSGRRINGTEAPTVYVEPDRPYLLRVLMSGRGHQDFGPFTPGQGPQELPLDPGRFPKGPTGPSIAGRVTAGGRPVADAVVRAYLAYQESWRFEHAPWPGEGQPFVYLNMSKEDARAVTDEDGASPWFSRPSGARR